MKSQSFALSRALPTTLVAAFLTALGSASVAAPTSAPIRSGAATPATSPDKSAAEIADDIAFAKGLASDWGFVNLATDVIKRLEQSGVKAETAVRLGVVKCEIYAQGALAERDRDTRNELFEQTLAAYSDFLTKNPNSDAAQEARSGFITMSSAFAHSLLISMEDAIGEQAEALRMRREEVLLAANDRTASLIEELQARNEEEPSETIKRELVRMMILRASLNLEIGKSSSEGAFSFEEARKILEDVVFLAGEGSPDALRAFDMIGQVFAAQENWRTAAIYFHAVVNQALPEDTEEWKTIVDELELSQRDKEQRWLFLELSIGGLINAYLSDGDVQSATRYAMHLYNTQRREGFEYSATMGYPSLLSAARVLLDSGGVVGGKVSSGEGKWYETAEAAAEDGHKSSRTRTPTTDLALSIAQQVINENPKSILRLKAQKLMQEIITRPGVTVDPAILYEVAEGIYNSGEDDDGAIAAFKVVLNALEGQSDSIRIELGAKTFFRIGRTYVRKDLMFEAAMAFREGCTTYVGDPEFDSNNAEGFYKSMQILLPRSKQDPALQALNLEAENIHAQVSTKDADAILWDQGERARRKQDYETAIRKYEGIQRSATDYEKAVVYTQICKMGLGERDTVLAALKDYLENYVTDDLNAVQGTKIAKRQDAMGAARYFRCVLEYQKKLFADVIASSKDYHEQHPEQTGFAPPVMNMVGNSYLETDQLPEARRMLEAMESDFPDDTWTSKLGIAIYTYLKDKRETLVAGSEKDMALALEMASLMEASNKNASKASFGNLRAESKHWAELGKWEKTIPVLEKLMNKFGALDQYKDNIASYVKPDLGEALLRLHRVQEAHELLAPLVMPEDAKPSKDTLLNFIRSTIGWVEGNASDIQEVPGAGTTEKAFEVATDKLNSLANASDAKWQAEWYNLKFQLSYGFYRWATAEGGPKNSNKLSVAQSQLNSIVQAVGSDFKGKDGDPGVEDACKDHPEFGNDVLRRRMVWLWGKVK